MTPSRLIFLGAPGTGKGTQAARMGQRYELQPISSGDALRREIEEATELGKQVEEYVGGGKLVPDDVITDVMLAAVDLAPTTGYILDGFPRTVPQAKALEKGLAERDSKIDMVIDFEMDHHEIVRRITSRRVCSDCKKTYNLSFLPPKQAGVCDDCGGKLMQRVDDREDVIVTRLETYLELTHPLIEYYSSRGLLRSVDASASADQVEAELVRTIESPGV